jgi:hypothetical protein
MSNGIGRISGPLLKDNLVRDGTDLAFETDLLYLEVNDEKIGIKTDSPSRDLNIEDSAKTINLIVDNYIDAANINIDTGSNITTDLDKLYLNAQSQISALGLKVDNLYFDNNKIYTYLENTDLEIRPTKKFFVGTTLDITGNLHATGDITLGGDIIFGDSDDDSVTFAADVDSNLTPDISDTYNLGAANKRWNNLYVKSIDNSLTIFADKLTVAQNINYNIRFSNAYFVSTIGSNSNEGNHQNAAFKNISYALSRAVAGDTVFIYPGTYTEIFPLIVPAGVSVVGFDIRATIVRPTETTNDKDAFLLNGETTISDITVKDFYYNVTNNTGYAFRFADNFTVTSRSPYVQNVSVITSPSAIPAGRGALVDGSVANANSKEASCLFHSVTFITPNSDALTITNGVRVEWLNSFTYFANRGIYATNGSLGFAGLGETFGAEIRSIGSANVYGNYGTVADGDSTLMYLINHNFGYIGSGLDSSNDNTLTIQVNETVELNSGKIYYTSQAQNGNFRVGNEFVVDFDTGSVSFDSSNIDINGASSFVFAGSNNQTFITADFIETGDFNLSTNIIRTLTRNFNVQSASENIVFLDDVDINKNLLITGNFGTAGTITFGNDNGDNITFNTDFTQTLVPKQDNLYDIGTELKIWKDVYLTSTVLQDINFRNNLIETTNTDSDLLFFGNGVGNVLVEDIFFKNNIIESTVLNSNLEISLYEPNSLVIFGTDGVLLPRATNVLNLIGELRYNTNGNEFEGYNGARTSLGGIFSQDKQTNVTIHPTNDTINFTANNITSVFINQTGLTATALSSGNLLLNNNTISSLANDDLTFEAGSVSLNDLLLTNNDISVGLDKNIIFNSTGLGFVSFHGTGALAIPAGMNDDRPASPIVGNTRFNEELRYMEVFDGANWIPASGTGELSTFEYANEQTTLWALVVG